MGPEKAAVPGRMGIAGLIGLLMVDPMHRDPENRPAL
jgi:hypothetical protein